MSRHASLHALDIRNLLLPRLQRKPLVRRHVHRHLAQQRYTQQPRTGHAGHDVPHDTQAVGERRADLVAQWLREAADHRDRRERDLAPVRELRGERLGERPCELVLEHGRGDGDAPSLGEGAREGVQRECGCGA